MVIIRPHQGHGSRQSAASRGCTKVPARKFKVWGSIIPGKLDALEAQHADTLEPSAVFAKVSQIGKAPVRPTVGG